MSRLFFGIFFIPSSIYSAEATHMKTTATPMADHTMVDASTLTWKQGPASLPKGTTMTLLEGDMSKDGPFTARF